MTGAEQLELDLRYCRCGARLVAAVNDRRGLCDGCILERTSAGHLWNEDPHAARRHLQRWLAARGLDSRGRRIVRARARRKRCSP